MKAVNPQAHHPRHPVSTPVLEEQTMLQKIPGFFRKLLLATALLTSAGSGLAQPVGNVTLMREVPDTWQLASALFPRPARGLVVHEQQARTAETPKIAFMIQFEYNSAQVLSESLPYLDAVGRMLKAKNLKDKSLIIEGHADAKGGYDYNLTLSELRAQAVKRYLVSVHGIDEKRLLCVGKGNTELLNRDQPFAAENRRVQFLAWNHD